MKGLRPISILLITPFLVAPGCPQEDACTTVDAMERYYNVNLQLNLDGDQVVCETDWGDCICVTLDDGACDGLAFVGPNAYECMSRWEDQHGNQPDDDGNDGDGIKIKLSNIETWIDGIQLWCFNYSTRDYADWYTGTAVIDAAVASSRQLTGWFDAGQYDSIQCNGYAWDGNQHYDLVYKTNSGTAGAHATISVIEGNQKNCSTASNGGYNGFNWLCRP